MDPKMARRRDIMVLCSDWAIAIACLSFGLATMVYSVDLRELVLTRVNESDSISWVVRTVSKYIVASLPIPIWLSIGILGLRARRPVFNSRTFVNEPGICVGFVVAIVLTQRLVGLGVFGLRIGFSLQNINLLVEFRDWLQMYFWFPLAVDISNAMLITLVLQIVTTGWRPIASGVDFVGRCLRVYWIVIMPMVNWDAYLCVK